MDSKFATILNLFAGMSHKFSDAEGFTSCVVASVGVASQNRSQLLL